MDARTGDVLLDGPLYSQDRFSFMGIMLSLHVDLFASLPGELFLGFMGLLFCVAIVSGVVLYGPFMKKLEFGTVRASRSTRLKWLDLHNLLGIVTLVWAFVGLTGVVNELSTPLFRLWQSTELVGILEPYKGQGIPAELASVQAAADTRARPCPAPRFPSSPFPATPTAALTTTWCGCAATPAHLAPEHAGAGGRRDRRAHHRGPHALVPDRAGTVAPAAFRRLRRHAAEDHLGLARPDHHRGAGQRPVPVAGASPRHRGAHRRPDAQAPGGGRRARTPA